jgi:hypothetical protein
LKVLCKQLHLAFLPVQILFAPLDRLGTAHYSFFFFLLSKKMGLQSNIVLIKGNWTLNW